jgi:hypothetical protein
MSDLILNKNCYPSNQTHVCNRYLSNNITNVPKYRINNSLSYQVSRCNNCGEEWNEYWISYRNLFSSLVYEHEHQHKR